MLFDLHDDGIASAVIPKPGQTVEECILEQLGVRSMDDVEWFDPKYLNDRLDVKRLVMLGRRGHKPGEGENMIANILTGKPEFEWCYGPYVVVARYGADFVQLPAECGFVADVIQKLSGIVLKDLPFTVPGEGVKNA